MKQVFVVDAGLDIHVVEVPELEWEREFFIAQIGTQPVIVKRGGWTKFTTYAGFETRQEAEEFSLRGEKPGAKVLVLTIETKAIEDLPPNVLCSAIAPANRKKLMRSSRMQWNFLYYLGRPIIERVCENPDIERVMVVGK